MLNVADAKMSHPLLIAPDQIPTLALMLDASGWIGQTPARLQTNENGNIRQ